MAFSCVIIVHDGTGKAALLYLQEAIFQTEKTRATSLLHAHTLLVISFLWKAMHCAAAQKHEDLYAEVSKERWDGDNAQRPLWECECALYAFSKKRI